VLRVKLESGFSYVAEPVAPYSFGLTVRKPAGWALFTPFEEFGGETVWTALHVADVLAGVRLRSLGSIEHPKIEVGIFTRRPLVGARRQRVVDTLHNRLGFGSDLKPFYDFARKDAILKHTVDDLYGMRDTSPASIFPDATLAILLQMTTLKRSNQMMDSVIRRYGRVAEFNGWRVRVWPTPERIAKLTQSQLARECNLGYRARSLVGLARKLVEDGGPTMEELDAAGPEEAKRRLMELPGLGDYSSDIVSPHGGFPIDVWSAQVFGKLFYGRDYACGRETVESVKREGLRRWGRWSWLSFFYVVQDLESLARKMGMQLRLE
jgi:3-methyladenine DNA glycosylase/8-oxoguanine DNA glycosylase